VASEETGGRGYLRLNNPDAWAATRPTRVAPAAGLRWLVRGRGDGSLQAITRYTDKPGTPVTLAFESDEWIWATIPIKELDQYQPLQLRVEQPEGRVDLDLVLLAAREWPKDWQPGDRMDIPASCLFHGGYSEGHAVIFRASHDPEAAVLYGPKLPLPHGTYRAELAHRSPAPAGTILGRMNVRTRGSDDAGWVPVVSGKACALTWTQNDNLPVNVVFVYNRSYDINVAGLIIEATHATP